MNQQQAYTFVAELKAKGANIIEHEWTDMAVSGRNIGTKLRLRGKEAELGPVEIKAAYQRWITQVLEKHGWDWTQPEWLWIYCGNMNSGVKWWEFDIMFVPAK